MIDIIPVHIYKYIIDREIINFSNNFPMDDLSDLPPLQPYNKKKVNKQEPNMPKIIPNSPDKNEAAKAFPEMNNVSNNLQKSTGLSPQNISKQFPNSASSMLRENQTTRVQTRKNRIQRTSKVDKEHRLVEELEDKELLRGRRMINNMINKTGTKNILTEAQTSIETINKNIEELHKQIEMMEDKIYDIDDMISNDPNNNDLEHRRKQLAHFVEKLETTSRLYKEQIDMRTENKTLVEKIQKLKQENMEIKGRVIEGLEKIEGHMHNLPCQREKSALIELEKVKKELERERNMREDLENRVQNTIQDFSRLYEEADLARKIIVGKLRKLEITEEQLDCGFMTIDQLSRLNPSPAHQPALKPQSQNPIIPSHNPPNTETFIHKHQKSFQQPSHSFNNQQSRMSESIRKPDTRQSGTILKKESNVRNRNLADKVGMMRGNMETFKKMKF